MDMQDEILDFWFGRPGTADYGSVRDTWFRKVAAFDTQIRDRFGAAIETALAGGTPRGAGARSAARPVHAQRFSPYAAGLCRRRAGAGARRGRRRAWR